jgi:hypothetical protein
LKKPQIKLLFILAFAQMLLGFWYCWFEIKSRSFEESREVLLFWILLSEGVFLWLKEKEHLSKRWIKELLSDIELFR